MSEKIKNWFSTFFDSRILALKKEIKKEYIDEKPINIFKNILLVFIGSVLLSLNSSIFIIPAGVITGGNSGLALIIEGILKLCGTSSDTIGGINTLVTIITVVFFFLGLILVGFDFSIKTALSTVVYPLFLWFFDWLRGLKGLEFLRIETYLQIEAGADPASSPNYYAVLLICGLIGGVILGTGVGLAFKGGGSTGGTDALIIFLSRHTKMSASAASLLIDATIIILGLFVVQDLLLSMVGIFASIICAIVIDKIFVGRDTTYTATVISSRWQDISRAINIEMGRGTTIYSAKGGYTGIERKVISVSFVRDEYRDILKIIQSLDRTAFVTISSATEVQGVGFSLDDGDEPIKLPKKASKGSTKSKKPLDDYEKVEQKQEKEIRKHVNQIVKSDKKEEKKQNKLKKK